MWCVVLDLEVCKVGVVFLITTCLASELLSYCIKKRKIPIILEIKNQDKFRKSLETTMETLDDNKNAMKEGTYIKMCNNVKNIWECVS
tara:strand:- start:509 stop:772 length:264 start_codon:yes stop_codon:yes gene_type:complete